MSIVAIKDHQKLVRDTHSKAVLNTDRNALHEYYAKREVLKQEKEEKTETKERLAKLESDMQDIKKLLIEIAALRKV
jgi:uncharacterized protein (UPF0276 family)